MSDKLSFTDMLSVTMDGRAHRLSELVTKNNALFARVGAFEPPKTRPLIWRIRRWLSDRFVSVASYLAGYDVTYRDDDY